MGKMGLLHAAILNSLQGSRIAAFAEPEKFVSGVLSEISDVPLYSDYKEMIQNGVDAAYITTPAGSHVRIAESCAEAGVHFFVEKPLGTDWKECRALVDAVKDCGVHSMVGYHLRHASTFLEARRLLDAGAIGNVVGAEASVFQTQKLRKPSGWRFDKKGGGGVMADLGSHLVDLLLWYFGGITSVVCRTRSARRLNVEDEADGEFLLKNGASCRFSASWNSPGYRLQETTISVVGTKGRIRVNEDTVTIDRGDGADTRYRQSMIAPVQVDIGGPEYTAEDAEFVACLSESREPDSNVESAARVQQVIDAAYLAAATGKPSEVESHG